MGPSPLQLGPEQQPVKVYLRSERRPVSAAGGRLVTMGDALPRELEGHALNVRALTTLPDGIRALATLPDGTLASGSWTRRTHAAAWMRRRDSGNTKSH
jgi:hypothetical protein